MRKIAPFPSTRGEPSFLCKKTTVGPAGTVSDRETERQRDKETERQRDRETERQSQRKQKLGQRHSETESNMNWAELPPLVLQPGDPAALEGVSSLVRSVAPAAPPAPS